MKSFTALFQRTTTTQGMSKKVAFPLSMTLKSSKQLTLDTYFHTWKRLLNYPKRFPFFIKWDISLLNFKRCLFIFLWLSHEMSFWKKVRCERPQDVVNCSWLLQVHFQPKWTKNSSLMSQKSWQCFWNHRNSTRQFSYMRNWLPFVSWALPLVKTFGFFCSSSKLLWS